MKRFRLCDPETIPEGCARGFSIETGEGRVSLLVINKLGRFYAYENRCPHIGTSLDWQPDQFLDSTNSLIQCSTHGALFRIQDGYCIHGPCVNQSLSVIPVSSRGRELTITL